MDRLRIADIILRNLFAGDQEYLSDALECADDIIKDSEPESTKLDDTGYGEECDARR